MAAVASRDGDRVVALSAQLAQAHQELRRQISDLRRGPALPTHCLAFCAALTAHHEGEDGGIFPQILRVRPDLAPTIAELVEDHGMIAAILARIGELAAGDARGSQIDGELAGLAAIMESHFAYEERSISRALDSSG